MVSNNNHKKGKKRKIIIIFAGVTIVSFILYMLAYRYLIERTEKPVAESNINIELNSSDNTYDNTSKIDDKGNAEYDDWNYRTENIEIAIDQITKGEGEDKITYFVADVKLKEASYLRSAFAKNSFGRNILETTSQIAKDNNAIFAINGDYYGFRGDGVLIRNGTLYRDIPTRTGAALYRDGTLKTYDETEVSSKALLSDGVINTLSFGPILVKEGQIIDDFHNVVVDTNFGNRSIQGTNPRTGVGIIEPNHFVFVVVDGRTKNYSRGMTLSEFAQVFSELGCVEAYNLDGGGSSTMYFMGRVVNNPLGEEKERKISDILYISE